MGWERGVGGEGRLGWIDGRTDGERERDSEGLSI